ncbi:MAG: polysaccharide pyruvyl transferase family protein [Clostridium sp.]|nr:polysaccharide pyruvyl transferase family protein [Clostridium sp.]
MIKVAIITINDYNNYGNRLQNYATQEVLKTIGLSVKTIITDAEYEENSSQNRNSLLDKCFKLKNMSAKMVCKKIENKVWYKIHNHYVEESIKSRLEKFKEFTSDNISETSYHISQSNISKNLADEFDYFIVGSDQVWNPTFRYGSSIDFLTFAPQYKRIAYAPSFGIDEIPGKYIEDYSKWISEMHRLSVREESGVQIIKKLTGRKAQVLIDPTLMISKEKWLSISKEDEFKPKGKYLLTYFLGDMREETKKEIKQIAMRNKLSIVNLGSVKDTKRYRVGPSEFINYINSASVLFTDSFHGCVFSILFNTPFVVLDREGDIPSMNSRIDTLLKTFKLDDRRKCNIKYDEQIFHVNYQHVSAILENERKKTMNYLKEALSILE